MEKSDIQLKLYENGKGCCIFCRIKMLKKNYHYCKECFLGEMCEKCAIEHKKGHLKEKDESITIIENIICGVHVKDSGNNTPF